MPVLQFVHFVYHCRGQNSVSTDEDEFVCIFGSSLKKSNRCTLMVFNKKREERCIAETDFRKNGAMACLDGKKMPPLSEQDNCMQI